MIWKPQIPLPDWSEQYKCGRRGSYIHSTCKLPKNDLRAVVYTNFLEGNVKGSFRQGNAPSQR